MSEQESTNLNINKETQPLTKTEKILKIIGIILLCIMGPILILDIVLLIKSATNPNEVPSIFGVKPLVIMSDSMELNKLNINNLQTEMHPKPWTRN